MEPTKKGILSKFEWFLLFVALGILAMVILQNRGVHVLETVESVEITKVVENETTPSKSISLKRKSSNNKDRLSNLADYFAENRARAKAEGKHTGFDWSSLKIPEDEKSYLQNKYGRTIEQEEASTDWLSLISKSHQTYKSVKAAFDELGIDTDKIVNSENASKALSNPLVANSIYQKMERDFGIPAEKSRSFAERNRQTLDKWAKFVEEEMVE